MITSNQVPYDGNATDGTQINVGTDNEIYVSARDDLASAKESPSQQIVWISELGKPKENKPKTIQAEFLLRQLKATEELPPKDISDIEGWNFYKDINEKL